MRQWDRGGGFSARGPVQVHGNDRAGREMIFRYYARLPRIHPPRTPSQGSDDPGSVDLDDDFNQDHFDHEFNQTVSL
jgi:hypothetical protein